jgi:hypothetical protein
MTMKTGTFDIAILQAATNVPVGSFTNGELSGEAAIAAIINADNQNFSTIVDQMLADLAETTSERIRPVGSSLGGNAMEVDEYGQGPTQRDVPGYFVGFPLKRITFPIGWTAQWLKNAMAADVAVRNGIAQGAHLRRLRYELQKAIFTEFSEWFYGFGVWNRLAASVLRFNNAAYAAPTLSY